jgi:hypothetical protein
MNSASVKMKVTALDIGFAIDTRLTITLAYLSQRMAAFRHSLQDGEVRVLAGSVGSKPERSDGVDPLRAFTNGR